MNRRDYAAHIALRDTMRYDRGLSLAPAVVIHKPRRKQHKPLRSRIANAVRALFV